MLLKLLKMTTSPNDGEALVAVRKANSLLTSAGWDWDKLIAGKIKVIADPFAGVAVNGGGPVFSNVNRPAPRPTRPPPPPPSQPFSPPPPPRPQPQAPRKPKINSSRTNQFPGACYCCGIHVASQAGFIFDPHNHNPRAKTKWQVVCTSCNQAHYPNIPNNPTPKYKPAAQPGYTPNLNDL